MKSILQKRLRDLDEINTTVKQQSDINTQLLDSGDAFELAARMVLGAWDNRAQERNEVYPDGLHEFKDGINTGFELGYKVAQAELALILRSMRKGAPPDKTELENIQRTLEKEILG